MLLSPHEKLDKRLPGIAVKAKTLTQLKNLSNESGISVSELMRRAIDLFLTEIATDGSTKFENGSNRREVER